jgi:hypothetical protein
MRFGELLADDSADTSAERAENDTFPRGDLARWIPVLCDGAACENLDCESDRSLRERTRPGRAGAPFGSDADRAE